MAAAGLWTTPTDLARFALEVSRAYRGAHGAFLTQETAREMLTPHVTDDYGLGFGIVGEGNDLRFSHGGSNEGYRCYLVMYPNRGHGAAIMTNGNGGADLIMEIIRAIADAYAWPDFKPETRVVADLDSALVHRYEGKYEIEPEFSVSIRQSERGLLATSTRRFPSTLRPESERVFFGTDINMRIRFDVDDAGDMLGFDILQGGREIHARKVR